MFLLWCERLTFLSLCLLIFVLPATIGGVSIFSCATILFFLVYKLASCFRDARQGQSWWAGFCMKASELWLAIPLVCYVVINFLAVMWSQYPQQSRKAFFSKVLGHVFIYLAARETVNHPRRLRILVNVIFTSAVIICLDALFQLWGGHDFFKGASLISGRVSAAFNHPNGLGAYLVLALPLMYAAAFLCWQQWRSRGNEWGKSLFLTVGLVLGMAVMGLTYSRGAWLGLIVAVWIFLLLDRKLPSIFFIVIAVLAILVYIPMLRACRHISLVSEDISVSQIKPGEAVEKESKVSIPLVAPEDNAQKQPSVLAQPFNLPEGESHTLKSNDWLDKLYIRLVQLGVGGSDRLIYWRDALKIVRDHPWTGTGLNTYAKTIKKYNGDRALYAHNGYLQMAAEIGLFGLAIFLWFLSVHVMYGMSLLKAMDQPTALLWIAILSAFVGFLINGFLDTTFYSVQHGALLWFFFGLLAAGRSLTGQKEPECR